MNIKFLLIERIGRSNPHAHGNAAWYFNEGFMNHIAYLTARCNLFLRRFLPIYSPYETAQYQNESTIIGRASAKHNTGRTSDRENDNQAVRNATRLSSGHGRPNQRAIRYAIWVEKMILRFIPRAVRYAIWVISLHGYAYRHAVRYAIWNSTFRKENYIAYLFRAITQPTIRIQPITNHHGKYLHPNPHSNRFRGSGQS